MRALSPLLSDLRAVTARTCCDPLACRHFSRAADLQRLAQVAREDRVRQVVGGFPISDFWARSVLAGDEQRAVELSRDAVGEVFVASGGGASGGWHCPRGKRQLVCAKVRFDTSARTGWVGRTGWMGSTNGWDGQRAGVSGAARTCGRGNTHGWEGAVRRRSEGLQRLRIQACCNRPNPRLLNRLPNGHTAQPTFRCLRRHRP